MNEEIYEEEKSGGGYLIAIILLVLALVLGGLGFLAVKGMFFPDEVKFSKKEHTMYVGDVLVMPAEIVPEVKNNELVYKSSNTAVATVTQNGVINAVGKGETKITAEHSFSGKTATLSLTVKESILRIELDKTKATVLEGEEISLKYELVSSGFVKVNMVYSTSDERVCTVNSDGIITAHDAGEAVVKVTDMESGISNEMKLTVLAPLQTFYFKNQNVDLLVGDVFESSLVFLPADTSDKKVEYSISPESLATTDEKGRVTGVRSGSVVLTATHVATGKTAKMRINVYEIAQKITLNKTQLLVKQGNTVNVLAEVSPATTRDKTLTWTSSDNSVAIVTVSGAGTANIKGISVGTCKIKATSNSNPEVTAELLVTVEKDETHTITQETYINGILVVNKTYGLPQKYNQGGGLTVQTKNAFAEMKKAAAAEGIELRIASGYRSYAYQKDLYNGYLRRPGQNQAYVETYSARPGHSEHQTGLAIDVNNASMSFLGTPEQIWLEAHCVEYGFIIRYPEGKQNVTGYQYEPWHIRYLGKETAKKVYDSGLCLEEYLGITSEYSY
ncbi:MAG: hypothetical protein E7509_02580 [Ruminococcus sp.]|nr:hypothetical protein [Ruminococcus sp.]